MPRGSRSERSSGASSEESSFDCDLDCGMFNRGKGRRQSVLTSFFLPVILAGLGIVCLGVGFYGYYDEEEDGEELDAEEAVAAGEVAGEGALVLSNPIIGNYTLQSKPDCWRFIDGKGHITTVDGQNTADSEGCRQNSSLFGLAQPRENGDGTLTRDTLRGQFVENNTQIAVDFTERGGPSEVIGTLRSETLSWPNLEVWSQQKPMANVVPRGKCSKHDYVKMWEFGGGHARGSFPERLSECGKKAYSLWHGFNGPRYERCVQRKVGLSAPCTRCYEEVAQYATKHCKSHCWHSWCSNDCLHCSQKHDLKSCVGLQWPLASTC
eukprot:TRINITY_DN10618_c0_g1_i1.p1 TRINITY_DN10618_c0_g1~~TRINITY_DN10618_c0_g1_i1.p1  ORF type:complete len:344 (-),score=52.20 TRINITY_DN10618_c0_g1_i1:210-1178(-)